jgi:hypothetical protein
VSNRYAIGFRHPGVAPGERVEVDAFPSINFEGQEVAVADSRFFDLLDVIVGGHSQLRLSQRKLKSMDPPGTFRFMFDDETRLPLDVAEARSKVTLVVENTSKKKRSFSGALFGGSSAQRG